MEGIYTTEQALLYIYENLKKEYKVDNTLIEKKKFEINNKLKHN